MRTGRMHCDIGRKLWKCDEFLGCFSIIMDCLCNRYIKQNSMLGTGERNGNRRSVENDDRSDLSVSIGRPAADAGGGVGPVDMCVVLKREDLVLWFLSTRRKWPIKQTHSVGNGPHCTHNNRLCFLQRRYNSRNQALAKHGSQLRNVHKQTHHLLGSERRRPTRNRQHSQLWFRARLPRFCDAIHLVQRRHIGSARCPGRIPTHMCAFHKQPPHLLWWKLLWRTGHGRHHQPRNDSRFFTQSHSSAFFLRRRWCRPGVCKTSHMRPVSQRQNQMLGIQSTRTARAEQRRLLGIIHIVPNLIHELRLVLRHFPCKTHLRRLSLNLCHFHKQQGTMLWLESGGRSRCRFCNPILRLRTNFFSHLAQLHQLQRHIIPAQNRSRILPQMRPHVQQRLAMLGISPPMGPLGPGSGHQYRAASHTNVQCQ
eukprot:comp22110_c0_seq1/m.51478 comp22110_c0_seq1/g.51478  ORF comp22110_c0_seq1/g.51478 comp22110_c0_seq1/m.51478 type:complete len:424 (+) comp22110_c0_seq1:261-1532(+)